MEIAKVSDQWPNPRGFNIHAKPEKNEVLALIGKLIIMQMTSVGYGLDLILRNSKKKYKLCSKK